MNFQALDTAKVTVVCLIFKKEVITMVAMNQTEHDAKNQTEHDESGAHGAAKWLSPDEQQVWRAYLHATTLLEDHLDRQLQRDAKMPHIYFGLLVQLSEAPKRRLRMTELAMSAKITRSRLSHAIARLEKNGWVRREDCPSDKRGQFAVLTDAGLDVLRQTAPGHVSAVRQALFDRLTPEQQKSLGEIMRIVAEGLQPKDAGADLPWLR
ncbi:MarR family transcriptional regulator [Streptomyces sp. NPDC046939]|uniref:MarR family winged helix-turn-helix transcriptional regulator n=1 Tax=Streptomyces sp. NPDC046939 TaxID=3155376 RepID=UPI0033CA72CD